VQLIILTLMQPIFCLELNYRH